MAEELNGSAIEAFWSGTSFLLCSTGMRKPSTSPLDNYLFRHSIPAELCVLLEYLRSPANGHHCLDILLRRGHRRRSRQGLHVHARRPVHPGCRRRRHHRTQRSHHHRSHSSAMARPILWHSECDVECWICDGPDSRWRIRGECDMGRQFNQLSSAKKG